MKFFAGVLAALVLSFLPSVGWGEPSRIGVVPFENVSGTRVASAQIMRSVEEVLEKRGFLLIKGRTMERFLEEERIRYLDSLPTPHAKKLASELKLDAILTGSILFFKPGATPQVGLTARLVSRDGTLLWGKTVGVTGDDQTTVLGLRKVEKMEELVPIAVRRLLEKFQLSGGVEYGRVWKRPSILLGPRPTSYLSPRFPSGDAERIAILPLTNQSGNKEAGRIVMRLLAVRLSGKGRFHVVEGGDLRESMIEEGVRLFGDIELGRLKGIGKALGTNLFLGGAIYKYSEGLGAGSQASPEVEFLLSIINAETGEILWTAHHTRKGEEYLTIFHFGLMRSPIALSDQVLEEMLDTRFQGRK
jgi:hypothetical protein